MIEKKRRKFTFKESEYLIPNKGKDRQRVKRIMTKGIKNKAPPETVLNSLKKAGLGYRRTNFFQDYGKASATEHSKTHQSYSRAKTFWESVVVVKKNAGLKTYPAAIDALRKIRDTDPAALTAEKIAEFNKLAPDHENVFGMSP